MLAIPLKVEPGDPSGDVVEVGLLDVDRTLTQNTIHERTTRAVQLNQTSGNVPGHGRTDNNRLSADHAADAGFEESVGFNWSRR